MSSQLIFSHALDIPRLFSKAYRKGISEPPRMPSQPNVHPCTFGCFEFCSEAPRMAGVLVNSEFAARKLTSQHWQGCQFRSGTDAAGSTQQRRFDSVRNSQSKMYMDVHFWRAAQDRSGILFIASMVQQQPSTWGEALRDFAEAIKRYKRIAWFLHCFNFCSYNG